MNRLELFRRNIIFLFVLFLITCSSGDKATEPEPVPPSASFTLAPSSGYAPLEVQFTSTSTGDITSYAWDFNNDLSTQSSSANPLYTYTQAGTYSVRLTVSGPGGSNFIIQENAVNVLQAEAPIVEDIEATTDEDVSISVTLTATDPQDLDLTISLGNTQPENGSVTLEGNILTYTPDANWNGTDTVSYKASNAYLDSNEGVISIVVNPVDDEPNTLDIDATTDEDTAISLVLAAEEVDGESYTFSIITAPSNGTATFSSGNTVSYTPDADWNGTDTFTFEATDNRNSSRTNIATATITVNPVNDAPIANDVTANVSETRQDVTNFSEKENDFNNIGISNRSMNITLDATDVDNSSLTYIVVSDVSNGTLQSDGTSSIIYTPTTDFNGTDSFTYKANDGTEDSNTATVTITIDPVNDAPVTTDVSFTTDEDTPYTESYTSYITDADGDDLTLIGVTEPSNGTAACVGTECTYTPFQDFNGTDSFTYMANDGTVDSNISTVSITVSAVNDVPIASDQAVSTDEDTNVTITLGASDVDGDALTFTLVTDVSNGTATLSGSAVTYTPNANFNGTDSFTFKANDGTADSNISSVTITVNEVNDSPTTDDQTASTDEDTSVSIDLTSTDPENDTVTYSIVTDVSNGTATLSGASVTYTPSADFNGTDSFTFNANDGNSTGNTSTVTITINSVNDAPVANDITAQVDESRTALMLPVSITLDATDVDGDALTYTLVTDVSNGTATLSDDTVIYTPTTDFNGTDSFTYKANDGTVDSNTATVDITVNEVNDSPTTDDQTASTDEDTSVNINLISTDPEGDAVTFSIVTDASNGTTTVSDDTVTYTPSADFNGTDSFTFNANDGNSTGNTSTVTITINPVNDAPTAGDQSDTFNEDDTSRITIQAAEDVDGDTLTYTIVTNPENGTLGNFGEGTASDGSSLSGNQILYTPDADWNGIDSFSYSVSDGTASSTADGTVTITILNTNDAPITSDQTDTFNEDDTSRITISGTVDVDSGDTLTYSVVTGPSNGVLGNFGEGTASDGSALSSDQILYTPDADWSGTDTFTFKVNDGTVDSNTSTVTLIIQPVADDPRTIDETVTIDQESDDTYDITITGASSPDGFALTYTVLEIDVNGSFAHDGASDTGTFTANAGLTGDGGTFTYKVTDTRGLESNISTVTISITDINEAPTTDNFEASVTANTDNSQNTVDLSDDALYSHWDDPDNNMDSSSIIFSVVDSPSKGTVTAGVGVLVYNPTDDRAGTDTFTFKVSDGELESNTSTATITIEGAAVTYPNGGESLQVGETHTLTWESSFSNNAIEIYKGGVEVNGGGAGGDINGDAGDVRSYDWAIPADFTTGSDYRIRIYDAGAGDGNDSSNADFAIVANSNNAPITLDISTSTNEDTDVDVTLDGSDQDGDTLTYTIVSQPSNGTLTDPSAGITVTYSPDANWSGTDTFTYKADDGNSVNNESNTATVTITVDAVNDAPVTTDQSDTFGEDDTSRITISGSSDVEGDDLTYSVVTGPSNGTLGGWGVGTASDGSALSGNQNLYTPDANWNGTDSFTFKVNDGTDDSNTSTATIIISPVNDAPTSEDEGMVTNEDTAVRTGFSSSDVDGDALTYIIVSQPANGTVTIDNSNSEPGLYTPDANFNGTDSFTYKANDGTEDSNVATSTVTVNAINDIPTTSDGTATVTTEVQTDLDLSSVASDVDGDNLTYAINQDVSNGTTSLSGSVVTYQSDVGFTGTDSFTFFVNDGATNSNTSTVTITVESANLYLDFDGSNDRVKLDVDWTSFEGYTTNTAGEGAGIEDNTIAMWIKADTFDNNPVFSSGGGTNSVGTNDTRRLHFNSSALEYILEQNNGQTSTTADDNGLLSSTETWYHVALVREKGISTATQNASPEGKGRRMYVNGVFAGSVYDGGARVLTDQSLNTENLFLGFGEHTGDNYFDGAMDDFAIWDDDLTVDEILAIYNLGIGADLTSDSGDYVSSSNLELFYDFNEDSTTIDDKTGNSAQDGVLEGGTFVGRSSITDSKIIPTSTLEK